MEALKDLAIKPIEKAISDHKIDHFIINQNYEIVIPESGKSLLHPNYFDMNTLVRLFEKLYQNKAQFVSNDVEVDSTIFVHRLNALSMFLKRRGEDTKAINRIITNIRGVEGSIKIESMTLHIFDDLRNAIFSKALLRPDVKSILNRFCQQWEVEKQHLLMVLEQLKSAE